METTKDNFALFGKYKTALLQLSVALLAMLIVFIGISALRQYKEYRFVGVGVEAKNTITVSGMAEVQAVPDVAIFTISVNKEGKTAKEAQSIATKAINDTIDFLKNEEAIAEKDIKTMNYNIRPRYEWLKQNCTPTPFNTQDCDQKRTLVGYQVSQSIRVKVRDIDRAGEVLAGVGSLGIDNVSGLSFEIDDDDVLKARARREAIADAKRKAEVLAYDLGVEIIRVAGFSEGGTRNIRPMYAKMMAVEDAALAEEVPSLPVGENTIRSNVTITYEIR